MTVRHLLLACAALAACSRSPDAARTRVTDEAAGGDVAAAARGSVAAPAFRLVIEPTGNEVRYRVREQLGGKDFPSDAIGKTPAVSGEIAFAADGSVIPDGSKITIDVSGLKSDSDRRDGYVRSRLLETDKYPTVVFAPNAVRGAPKVLPTTGSTAFSILGNLTIKGVTRPATWFVSAKFGPSAVTGSANTAFTFDDISLTKPRVPIVLSVADTIKLEFDFSFAVRK